MEKVVSIRMDELVHRDLKFIATLNCKTIGKIVEGWVARELKDMGEMKQKMEVGLRVSEEARAAKQEDDTREEKRLERHERKAKKRRR